MDSWDAGQQRSWWSMMTTFTFGVGLTIGLGTGVSGSWWMNRSRPVNCQSAFSGMDNPEIIKNLTLPIDQSFTVRQGEPQRYTFSIDDLAGFSYSSNSPTVCFRITRQDVPNPAPNLASLAYLENGNYFLDLSVPQGQQQFDLVLHHLQMSAHAMVYALQEYDTTQKSLEQLGQGFQDYAIGPLKAQQKAGDGQSNEDLILQAYLELLTEDVEKSNIRIITTKLICHHVKPLGIAG